MVSSGPGSLPESLTHLDSKLDYKLFGAVPSITK